jgi:hypothetical protein
LPTPFTYHKRASQPFGLCQQLPLQVLGLFITDLHLLISLSKRLSIFYYYTWVGQLAVRNPKPQEQLSFRVFLLSYILSSTSFHNVCSKHISSLVSFSPTSSQHTLVTTTTLQYAWPYRSLPQFLSNHHHMYVSPSVKILYLYQIHSPTRSLNYY